MYNLYVRLATFVKTNNFICASYKEGSV